MISLRRVAANVTELTLSDIQVLFSYDTAIAYRFEGRWYRTDRRYSVTTSKHATQNLPANAITLPHDVFTDNLTALTGGTNAHD